MMPTAPFTERFVRVRLRFVSSLETRINDIYAALPKLSGNSAAVAATVNENYRRIHSIVGVSPAIGFIATGRAARAVENVFRPAMSALRGLTAEEIDVLRKALQELREASQHEFRSTSSSEPQT